jgi:hypothetical protein
MTSHGKKHALRGGGFGTILRTAPSSGARFFGGLFRTVNRIDRTNCVEPPYAEGIMRASGYALAGFPKEALANSSCTEK